MANPESIFKNANMYVGQETIGGISCTVGYIKKFKWSWVATQLNMFVIIGNTNDPITKQGIENFSSSCLEYALQNNKGWPRGLQAAVGSVAILQGNSIENEAVEFCEKISKKHWSAFEIAVLNDTKQKKAIRFKNNPIFGAIYYPFFAETIDSITAKLNQ